MPAGGPPPFESTFGPFVVGALLALYISGLVAGQAMTYYTHHPYGTDRKIFFAAVTALCLLDALGSVCASYNAYYFSVMHWGDMAALTHGPATLALNPPITGMCALIVQSFYAYRVWVVSGKKLVLPIIILVFSVVQMGFSWGGLWMVLTQPFSNYYGSYQWGIQLWLCNAVAGDVIITSSIIYYLHQVKKSSGFAETTTMVKRIMQSTFENNSLTAAFAIADTMAFSLSTKTNWHLVCGLVLHKLYIMSLLISLNARSKMSRDADASIHSARRAGSGLPFSNPNLPRSNIPLTPGLSSTHKVSFGGGYEDFTRSNVSPIIRMMPRIEIGAHTEKEGCLEDDDAGSGKEHGDETLVV